MTAALEPQDLTAGEARECITRIRDSLSVAWDWVIKAYAGRAWIALGYPSWDALCDREFDGARIRLPREERREVVATLREAGMSTRAIASATGVSHPTVIRDLPGGSDVPPVAPVTGIDGKHYTATQPTRPVLVPQPMSDPDEVLDAEIVDADESLSPEAAGERVEQKQRRRPITDSARDAGWDLNKAVERIERLLADDRYGRNANQVAPLLRGHLMNAVKALSEALDQLPTS